MTLISVRLEFTANQSDIMVVLIPELIRYFCYALQYLLCASFIVRSMYCAQLLLCAVFIVYSIYCVQYLLSAVNIVCNIYCVQI